LSPLGRNSSNPAFKGKGGLAEEGLEGKFSAGLGGYCWPQEAVRWQAGRLRRGLCGLPDSPDLKGKKRT